jgi:hypothetical protein
MSKDKTYILRRPIKAKRMNSENWRDIFEVDMPASWDAEQSITYELQEDDFNKTFVEFDEDATRKQIFEDKELFRLASLIGCDGEDWQIERRKNNLVDYVFSLITGEK